MAADPRLEIFPGSAADRHRTRFPYGYFAFVMATGIVSIAAGLIGLGRVAACLFVLNLIAFLGVWISLALHLWRRPAALFTDLSDRSRAPGMLTIVAATCVIGNEIAAGTGYHDVAGGLCVAAFVLWFALVYGFFVAMTIGPATASASGSGIDGSWLLIVVATQALAILATRAADLVLPADAARFAGLCLFLVGGGFYLILLVMIVYRWLFAPMRPEQFTAPYWINMGAAAISALAGSRLFVAIGAEPTLAPVRGVVFTTTVLFWSFASWWIPLLVALWLWRYLSTADRRVYRLENWAVVFPLGMYTTASWRLSHDLGLSFLRPVPEVFVWIALAPWVLTCAGMVRNALRPPTPVP